MTVVQASVVVAALSIVPVGAGTAVSQGQVPADAVAFGAMRDVRPFVTAAREVAQALRGRPARRVARVLRRWEGVLTGPAVAMVFLEEGDADPVLAWSVPIGDASADIDALVRRTAVLSGPREPEFTGGPVRTLDFGRYRGQLYWTVRDGVLIGGTHRGRVEKLRTAPRPGELLADTDAYRRVAKHVDFEGDFVGFLDLERAVWRELLGPQGAARTPPSDLPGVLASWIRPRQFRAMGFSWRGRDSGGSGRLAATVEAPRRGLAALLDVPNATPGGFERLPEDCQIVQWKGPLGRGFLQRHADFLKALDPDVAAEFQEELEEFNRELGVDLGEDFLENSGSSVTGFFFEPPDVRLHFAGEFSDTSRFHRCVEALATYNATPLGRREEAGRTVHILPFALPAYYVIDGKWILGSTHREALAGMVASPGEKRSVLASPVPQRLMRRMPSQCVALVALDLRWIVSAASDILPLLLGSMDLRTTRADRIRDPLRTLPDVEPGLSVGVALRNEPDAFVLAIESVAVDPWTLIPRIVMSVVAAER